MSRRRAAVIVAAAMLVALFAWLMLSSKDEGTRAPQVPKATGAAAAAPRANPSAPEIAADATLNSEAPQPSTTGSVVASAESTTANALAMSAAPAVGDGEWLAGTVTSPDGTPIEGAQVTLFESRMEFPTGMGGAGRATFARKTPAGTGATDEEGRYSIPLDIKPPIAVSATADELAERTVSLYPGNMKRELDPWGRRIVRVDFVLPPEARLAGRVVDEAGAPVPGASIEAIQHDTSTWGVSNRVLRTATADAAGGFVVAGLRDVPCKLRLAHDGFATAEHVVENVSEVRDWKLSRAGGAIAGRVVLQATGEPVAGAVVQAWKGEPENRGNEDPIGTSTTTGADGTFRIEPLQASFWDVVASAGALRCVDADSPLGRRIAVGEEQVVDGVVFTLGTGWRIEGVVLDAISRKPVGGAAVAEAHAPDTVVATTGADGRFAAEGVFGRKAFGGAQMTGIMAFKEGWTASEAAGVDLSLSDLDPPPVVVEMVPNIAVRGVVQNANGDAAPRIPVSLYDRMRGGDVAFSDERGRFELSAPASSTAQVQAKVGELKSFSQPFDVGTEPVEGVEVALDPGGTLVVRCVDESGAPAGNLTVWMMVRTRGLEGWGSAMRDGSRMIEEPADATFAELPTTAAVLPRDLESCSLDVGVYSDTWSDAGENGIELKPGETKVVTLALKPKDATHFIDGTVVDWEERPVEGAVVQAWGDAGNGEATSDALGSFRLENLSPGKYSLMASHPDYTYGNAMEVEADTAGLRLAMKGPRTRWVAQLVDAETGERLKSCSPELPPLEGQKVEAYVRFDEESRTLLVGSLMPGIPRRVLLKSEGYEPTEIEAFIPEGRNQVEATVRMRPVAIP